MGKLTIEEIIPGCVVLNHPEGRMVFGAPSDVVKFFTIQNKEIGHVFVLPDKLYDKGSIQSVEFPLYKHIFGRPHSERESKFTIIGASKQIDQISAVLQQTVLGPTDSETYKWSTNGEADFILKIRSYFRKDFTDLKDIISFIPFDEKNTVTFKEVVLKRCQNEKFEAISGKDRIFVDIYREAIQSPPVDYVPPSELIKAMRLGAVVMGTSSGFDPKGDTSNIIIFAKHLGISIDGNPWMSERLNLYGIPQNSIKLFIITHLHDDHSNIFNMIFKGFRSCIATTNLIFQSFLVKASSILNIPLADVERMIDFVELKPGKKVKWYSNEIECFYTIHPIPTIGISINDRIFFSGDTMWGPELKELVKKDVIDEDYFNFLMKLPQRDCLELIFMDGGGPPIHPDPKNLARLPKKIRNKMFLTHLSDVSPELERKLNLGKPGAIFKLDDSRENLLFEDVLELSESMLMKGVSHEWLRVFCCEGKVIENSYNKIIIEEGADTGCFYFVLRGTLNVIKGNETVARIFSGDYFGEMAFLGSKKRNAKVVSESPVKLLAIPGNIFYDFINDEKVKRNLMKIIQLRSDFFHTSVFGDTPESYLNEIILKSTRKEYVKDDVIIAEGDMGNELFIILKGKCEVSKIVDNKRVVLKILNKNDIFGEMALLRGDRVRMATVTAIESSEVAIISNEHFSTIIKEIPSIFYNLMQMMDERNEMNVSLLKVE